MTPINISDEARECALQEIDVAHHPASETYKPLGHHIQLLLNSRDAELQRLRSDLNAAKKERNLLRVRVDELNKHFADTANERDAALAELQSLRRDKAVIDSAFNDSNSNVAIKVWNGDTWEYCYNRETLDAAMSGKDK